jgi:hypothetical protein
MYKESIEQRVSATLSLSNPIEGLNEPHTIECMADRVAKHYLNMSDYIAYKNLFRLCCKSLKTVNQKKIFCLAYGRGYTQKQIVKHTGKSKQSVNNLSKKVKEHLQGLCFKDYTRLSKQAKVNSNYALSLKGMIDKRLAEPRKNESMGKHKEINTNIKTKSGYYNFQLLTEPTGSINLDRVSIKKERNKKIKRGYMQFIKIEKPEINEPELKAFKDTGRKANRDIASYINSGLKYTYTDTIRYIDPSLHPDTYTLHENCFMRTKENESTYLERYNKIGRKPMFTTIKTIHKKTVTGCPLVNSIINTNKPIPYVKHKAYVRTIESICKRHRNNNQKTIDNWVYLGGSLVYKPFDTIRTLVKKPKSSLLQPQWGKVVTLPIIKNKKGKVLAHSETVFIKY